MSLIRAIMGKINSTEFRTPRIDPSTNAFKMINYEHSEIHGGSKYFIKGYTTLADAGVLYVKIVTPDSDKWSHFTWRIKSNGILTTMLYEKPSGGMDAGSKAVIHANNRNKNCWSGSHTPVASSGTVMTDSTAAFTIDALIGMQIFNQTDKSSGIITDNDATSVTVAALAGGTDNDWDTDDVYEINNSQMVIDSGCNVATNLGLIVSQASVGGTGFKSNVGGEADREDEIILKRNTTYLRSFLSGSDDNIISFKASWYEHTDKD